jgi:FkbM family methyltransferase
MTEPNPSAEFNRWKACRHGVMVYNANDRYVGRALDLYGEFGEEEVALFRQFVRPGDVVVDAGANIGTHTIPLARMVGPEGAVLAFEPQRLTYQSLCANVALNSLTSVFCYFEALGAEAGEVVVPRLDPRRVNTFAALSLADDGPREEGRFALLSRVPAADYEEEHGERAAVVPLDEVPLKRCRFLKVDVEGMELDVLKGAAETIRRFRPILYVESAVEAKVDALSEHLAAIDYDWVWHTPRLYNPDNFFQNPENIYGDVVALNRICLPRGSGIAFRFKPKDP